MEVINVQQNSDEWFAARLAHITGSMAGCLLVNGKKGVFGTGACTEMYRLAAERITGKIREGFTNKFTEHGHEYEPIARRWYELQTFQKVELVGFVEQDEWVGCSPDGLTSDKVIEIKCPEKPAIFMSCQDEPDKSHLAQCNFNMMVCQKDECDLIYYHPYFEDGVIHTIQKDEDMIAKFRERIPLFKDETNKIINTWHKAHPKSL